MNASGSEKPPSGDAPEPAAEFRVEDRRVAHNPDRPDVAQAAPVEVTETPAEEPSPERSAPRFSEFIFSLYHIALYHLGHVPGPSGEKPTPNLDLARENIDIIEMLAEKTSGNRSSDEDRLLEQVLTELRMLFLQGPKG